MRNAELQSWMVERPDTFDYQVGRDLFGPRAGITKTSAPRPERFTWGKVLRVYVVGDDYAIVKYVPRRAANVSPEEFDPSPNFHLFVRGASSRGWDTSHSYGSLDAALIAGIAWRSEQRRYGRNVAANSQAATYVSRMIGLD